MQRYLRRSHEIEWPTNEEARLLPAETNGFPDELFQTRIIDASPDAVPVVGWLAVNVDDVEPLGKACVPFGNVLPEQGVVDVSASVNQRDMAFRFLCKSLFQQGKKRCNAAACADQHDIACAVFSLFQHKPARWRQGFKNITDSDMIDPQAGDLPVRYPLDGYGRKCIYARCRAHRVGAAYFVAMHIDKEGEELASPIVEFTAVGSFKNEGLGVVRFADDLAEL